MDKAVMQQLRDLAYDGRTVVVVTHSMANLDTCDRLLVLAPGGKMAFYGPPGEALRYFGLPGWAEVFQAFDHYPGRDWAAELAESPAYAEWVELQRPKQATQPNELQPPPAPPPQRRGRLRQTITLTRRYARPIAATCCSWGCSGDPLWRHTSGNWLRDVAFTIGLAVVFSLLTWMRLRRLGPRRRR